jgi:hypothetical protein
MWCAFKSIGAVKRKRSKERALNRLYYTCNENLLAFLQGVNIPVNQQIVKLQEECNKKFGVHCDLKV